MGKCKTKAIQTDLGIFRHNQAYPGIIQAYPKLCVTLAYLEPWYIQNPDIQNQKHIQNSGLFRHLRRQASTKKRFVKIVENSFVT